MAVPTLPLSNEDELNLSGSIVDTTEGNLRITNGRNFFRLASAEIDTLVATIPYTELEGLYDEVNVFCSTAKDCLTAIRFYYVADSTGESAVFDLYFQPLYLSFDQVDPTGKMREYSIAETGKIYSFSAGKFTEKTTAELSAAQGIFAGELTLKPTPTSANFETYTSGVDVESCVLPFQTIFALLNDNGTGTFKIKHCADIEGTTVDGVVKESLILDAEEISNNGPFAGKFANRVHKFPPYSNIFSYSII